MPSLGQKKQVGVSITPIVESLPTMENVMFIRQRLDTLGLQKEKKLHVVGCQFVYDYIVLILATTGFLNSPHAFMQATCISLITIRRKLYLWRYLDFSPEQCLHNTAYSHLLLLLLSTLHVCSRCAAHTFTHPFTFALLQNIGTCCL